MNKIRAEASGGGEPPLFLVKTFPQSNAERAGPSIICNAKLHFLELHREAR